jgi:hypothetical protein
MLCLGRTVHTYINLSVRREAHNIFIILWRERRGGGRGGM